MGVAADKLFQHRGSKIAAVVTFRKPIPLSGLRGVTGQGLLTSIPRRLRPAATRVELTADAGSVPVTPKKDERSLEEV